MVNMSLMLWLIFGVTMQFMCWCHFGLYGMRWFFRAMVIGGV